jgi:hypothetical protein
MLLALTYVLYAALPIQAPGPQNGGAERNTALVETAQVAPATPRTPDLGLSASGTRQLPATDLLPQLPPQPGSGDGDHSDHMTPMWIMMGVMVAVMVVGMGVYASNHRGTAAATLQATVPTSPASLAVPVGASTGGSSR